MKRTLNPISVYKCVCLTARCNNILVIIPRDRTANQDAFRIFQTRQMSRVGNRGNLDATSLVPRNMSITFILQIPMETRSNLNSCCAFNPGKNKVKKMTKTGREEEPQDTPDDRYLHNLRPISSRAIIVFNQKAAAAAAATTNILVKIIIMSTVDSNLKTEEKKKNL